MTWWASGDTTIGADLGVAGDFAEIEHPDYPAERLICCYNRVLAAERARMREDLLTATEKDLDKIAASVTAGRLKDAAKIGERTGKAIGKHKMARHFITETTSTSFTPNPPPSSGAPSSYSAPPSPSP